MPVVKRIGAATAALFLALSLSSCRREDGTSSGNATSEPVSGGSDAVLDAAVSVDPDRYTDEDLDDNWSETGSTAVTLNGSSIQVSGGGAAVNGSVLTISKAGTYVLKGELTDGQVIVDAGKEDLVKLVLNGATLACSNSAPLYIKQADGVILTLAEGTLNTLTDGETYAFAAGEDEPNAALFSKQDLTINGTGVLTVTARYNNGITSKDDLVIVNGEISVTAAHDGIRGKDSVSILGGTITVTAEGDGIKSNNDTDADKGWIALDGGTFTIEAGNDGIQAETALAVTGGSYRIVCGGGSASVSKTTGTNPGWNFRPGGGTAAAAADEESYKGIKAGTALAFKGGTFVIDSADDALHANGDVTIAAGTFELSTGDDGVHADGTLAISGGTIAVKTSYEGLEGSNVTSPAGTSRSKLPTTASTPRAAAIRTPETAGAAPTASKQAAATPLRFPAAPWSSMQEATGSIPMGP